MKDKELRLQKTFHITPETAQRFEALRLDLFKRTGLRVGSSDFFAYMVKEQFEIIKNETNATDKLPKP